MRPAGTGRGGAGGMAVSHPGRREGPGCPGRGRCWAWEAVQALQGGEAGRARLWLCTVSLTLLCRGRPQAQPQAPQPLKGVLTHWAGSKTETTPRGGSSSRFPTAGTASRPVSPRRRLQSQQGRPGPHPAPCPSWPREQVTCGKPPWMRGHLPAKLAFPTTAERTAPRRAWARAAVSPGHRAELRGGGTATASGSRKLAGERPALQGFTRPEATAP